MDQTIVDQTIDDLQRPLTQSWSLRQQTVFAQQCVLPVQVVFPQQVSLLLAQKPLESVIQHCWELEQDVLPQQVRESDVQKAGPPSLLVQHLRPQPHAGLHTKDVVV